MRYEVLGPLRVAEEGRHSSISARKIETVLALLLVRCDQVVLPDQLIAEVWGDHPPRRATAGLHVYISQLRKFLHRPERAESRLVTQPPGYLLRQGSDELDFQLFLERVGQGRAHLRERRYEAACDCFERALELWRGPVLGDISGPVIDGFVAWLMEVRMECLELLGEAHLQLGRHRELVGRLYSLTAEHPLRETFYRQLMLALYRSERQADALKVYETARRVLVTKLGLEPCRALRELQQAILVDDDRLELATLA
ncbi:MAG TPA: AfsR/SARP family transcriptional regulator [Micromonosporaceae bacterium]|nr:AfsR/SARP family transcriptional regulator [Micromonosporaceae bacterium]